MYEGAPYALKNARTVLSRGKVGDYIKNLPIAIILGKEGKYQWL